MREKLLNILRFILRYVLWLASCAGGFYLLLRARTTILFAVTGMFQGNVSSKYGAVLVDRWSMIIMAIILVIVVGLVEYYYTRATKYGDLFSRFLYVTGIELLVLAGNDALVQIIIGLQARTTLTVLFFVVELVVGAALASHRSWWPQLMARLTHQHAQ